MLRAWDRIRQAALADQCERQPGAGRVEVDDANLAVGGLGGTGAADDGQRGPGWLPLAAGRQAHPCDAFVHWVVLLEPEGKIPQPLKG